MGKRILTITRRRAMTAALSKMKVYIEDPIYGDVNVSGVPCHALGELRNGETKQFYIDSGKRKIFVVCNGSEAFEGNQAYEIPAGTDDIYVSGKNYYAPYEGNPFLFSGISDRLVQELRKNSVLPLCITAATTVLVLAAAVVLILGLFGR